MIERLRHAAPVYLLAHEPDVLVRHATLVEPAPRPRAVRVNVHPTADADRWEIDIATRDMRGLLARICAVLAERGLEIVNADLATWGDGAVLDTFLVRSAQRPQAPQLAFELEKRLRRKIDDPRRVLRGSASKPAFSLDNDAHPWHSVVTVTGADQPGLVQAVAAAFARARINVHHARITTVDGEVSDRFEVSTRHGRKITDAALSRACDLLA